MFSAISFGVFWRAAPSTSAIMRSMKPEPGAAVMRTRISSESTRVPPVTAERSPPASRITGADSPVIADSSTVATPLMTSPSPGISSPAVTTTTSPSCSAVAGTASVLPAAFRRRATVCVLVARRLAACALPRPSARASAKFANSTVNQSQAMTWAENRSWPLPWTRSCRKRIVASSETSAVMKMTGFFASVFGCSFTKASRSAGPSRARSNRPLEGCVSEVMMALPDQYRVPASRLRCSTIGPSARAGK